MSIARNATNLIEYLADVFEAARLTAGQNSMSPERLAQARELVLQSPAAQPAQNRGSRNDSISSATHRTA